MTPEERDRAVLRLYEQLLDIEQRLIPTGLHIFGRPPEASQRAAMLCMIASFDRPEAGAPSLADLIASGLGLPDYPRLLSECEKSPERLAGRERVESALRGAVDQFLTAGAEAAARWLEREAAVAPAQSMKVFALLGRVCAELDVNTETDALLRALGGEYIEPGPGGDLVQNPGILPTGRNTHAVNPYGIPSPAAWRKSEAVVAALLDRHLAAHGRYPQALAMVLWGMDNIKSQGEGVAQALRLLGVEPRRDAMNRVTDVAVIPLEKLGRPRIDLVLTVSGIFRDLFGATAELLDKAVRTVASLDEPPETNFLRKHVLEQTATGEPFGDAAVRVFSNAPGNYGTNVNFMVIEGHWDHTDQIADLFIRRKCFAIGRGIERREARRLLEHALQRVEATYQNIDSAEVGITDVDHYFEYLGGLSRAVTKHSGARPAVYLSDTLNPAARVRTIKEVVALETRTKTLNPKWYEGMLKHGYAGVAEIEHHVTNTFGWSATADAVDGWVYDAIAETFVLDEAMLSRLREQNPHAARNLAGRLLEAEARGFWPAAEEVVERLRRAAGALDDHLEGVPHG